MKVALLLLLLAVVSAADYTWNTASGGNFTDDAKWNPSAPPLYNYSIEIDITMLGTGNAIYLDGLSFSCNTFVAKDGILRLPEGSTGFVNIFCDEAFNVTGTLFILEEEGNVGVNADDMHVTGSLTTDASINIDDLHLYDGASLEFLDDMYSIDNIKSYGTFGTITVWTEIFLDILDLGSGTIIVDYITVKNLTLTGTTVVFNQSETSLFYISTYGRATLTDITVSAVPDPKIWHSYTTLLSGISGKPVTMSGITEVNGEIAYNEYEESKSTVKFYHDLPCPKYRYLVPTGEPCDPDVVTSSYGYTICGSLDICLNTSGQYMCQPESELPNAYCKASGDCQNYNPVSALLLFQTELYRTYTVEKKSYECNTTINRCYVYKETENITAYAYEPCIGNINCIGPGAQCVNGHCEPVAAGDPCNNNQECAFGHYCNSSGRCAALLSPGEKCVDSFSCADPYLALLGGSAISNWRCTGNSSDPRCTARYSLKEGEACSSFEDCSDGLYCNFSSSDPTCYSTGHTTCDTNADCDSWNYEYCMCPLGGGEKRCVNPFKQLSYGYPRLYESVKASHDDAGCGNNISCIFQKSENDLNCDYANYFYHYSQIWVQMAPGETSENLLDNGIDVAFPCSGVAFSGAPSWGLLLLAVAGTLAVYFM